MDQNQYYSAIMDLVARLCPVDSDELRFKAYAPLDGSYMGGICAYRVAGQWDTVAMTPAIAEDLHGLVMDLRNHVIGGDDAKWLVTDMRLVTATGAFKALFDYEAPENDMVEMDDDGIR